MCSQQWRPNSTNFSHAKTCWDTEHEPLLQIETDRVILRHVYHNPFMVKFPDECEWQKRFEANIKENLVRHMDRPKTNKGTGAGVYR
jgi:hypothetical protein